jgi:hypothetical protein
MAYSQIQQANEALEDEIAPSPPRSIPRTGTLRDHLQENLGVSAYQSYLDTPLITSAISLRRRLDPAIPACCRQ